MAKAKKSNKAEGAKPAAKQSDQDNSKLVAILAYFLIGIIWYFVDESVKKSSLAKFHVKQALNLLIISIVISIVLSILATAALIPVLGIVLGIIIGIVSIIIGVAFFVLWLIGLISAINGTEKQIPIIGHFAGKYLTF